MPGFPDYFYPFTNVPGYLSPLVAVQVVEPKGIINNLNEILNSKLKFFINFFLYAVNLKIKIECRAWAKNINSNINGERRNVNFKLTINN